MESTSLVTEGLQLQSSEIMTGLSRAVNFASLMLVAYMYVMHGFTHFIQYQLNMNTI